MRHFLLAVVAIILGVGSAQAYINGRLPGESEAQYNRRTGRGRNEFDPQLEKDLAAYTAAVIREPANSLARYQRGMFYLRHLTAEPERFRPRARDDFDEAIRIDPKFARAYYARLFVPRPDATDVSVQEDLDAALKHDPDFVPALLYRAHQFVASPQATHAEHCAALAAAERARELVGDKNPRVLCCVANAFAGVGDFERAAQWAEKAVALTPPPAKPATWICPTALNPRRLHEAYRVGRRLSPFDHSGVAPYLHPDRVVAEFGLREGRPAERD